MVKPRNASYFNLSGGINNMTVASGLDRVMYAKDSSNVEILKQGGIAKMKGNVNILDTRLEDGARVASMYTYRWKDKEILLFSAGSRLYSMEDINSGVATVLKTNLEWNAPCTFKPFTDGVVIGNAYDDLMYWEYGQALSTLGFKTKFGVSSRIFFTKSARLFVFVKEGIRWCSIGDPYDWDTTGANGAGYIFDWHDTATEVTGVEEMADTLIIHKKDQTFVFYGDSPDTFTVRALTDRGSVNNTSIIRFEDKQIFWNHGLFNIYFNYTGTTQLAKELTLGIRHWIDNSLDYSKEGMIFAIAYPERKQLWFYFPSLDGTYCDVCWIIDYNNAPNASWLKREMTEVLCGCYIGGRPHTGTADGRILREDWGGTEDGEPYLGYWYTPYLTYGTIQSKRANELLVSFNSAYNNILDLEFRYNTDDTKSVKRTAYVRTDDILMWDVASWDTEIFPDARTVRYRVPVPNEWDSLQVGFSSMDDFGINGFDITGIEVTEVL